MFLEAMLAANIIAAKAQDVKPTQKTESKNKTEQSYYKSFDPHVDVTPSARACPDVSGPYVTGSYLYWKAKLEYIPIAGKITYNTLGNTGNLVEPLEMDFDWQSGFKAGVGYNFKRDGWDIYLNWTHIRPNNHQTLQGPQQNGVLQNFDAFFADTLATTGVEIVLCNAIESRWSLNYNVLDFEIGRHFFIGRNLSLRPFFGVKGAVLTERLKLAYFNDVEVDLVNPDPGPKTGPAITFFDLTTQKGKQLDHDIGPRVGINTRWNLTQLDFAFIANASFSLMWDRITIHTRGEIFQNGIDAGPTVVDLEKQKQTFMEPVYEVFLGFDWRRCFYNWFSVDITAGYEMQFWPDQNRFISFGQPVILNKQNLSLQGLTASVKFDF